jgi:hypothetical protein
MIAAANYDERNSANLLATHMETIERIEKVRAGKGTVRVLDLGEAQAKISLLISLMTSIYTGIMWILARKWLTSSRA